MKQFLESLSFSQLLSKRDPQAFSESVRWQPDLTPRRRNQARNQDFRLSSRILPERALSFPLNKGNEGSEEEIESDKVVWNL